MLFTSFPFIIFLAIVVVGFYALPHKLRKIWLILSSYYFYCSVDIRLVLALLWTTAITYMGGYFIYLKKRKKHLYFLFFTTNMVVLFVFKYLPFSINTVNTLLNMMGGNTAFSIPEIFVPIGLSFMIFQSTTYLGGIYHGKMKSCGMIDVALFVSFFPSLLSGPIQKAHKLIPQFSLLKGATEDQIKKGILLILYGFCVKLYVADVLAQIVNRIFDEYRNFSGAAYWVGAMAFSLQIYADFLSYSDIACGSAHLFGIDLSKNFQYPYLARNISEFWRNWHMSLNKWFMEYVYFPMGGNRKGPFRTKLNKFFVFLCSGIWHGANWHYVAWGAANGLLQLVGDSTRQKRIIIYEKLGLNKESKCLSMVQVLCVFLMITTTWVFFRIPSTMGAVSVIADMYHPRVISEFFSPEIWNLFTIDGFWILPVTSTVTFSVLQLKRRNGLFSDIIREPHWVATIMIAGSIVLIVVSLCSNLAQPDKSFLYFAF